MANQLARYIKACEKCQKNKSRNKNKFGYLSPLPIPERNWEPISMDLITSLPVTPRGYDAIFVVVVKLSKMTYFVPTNTTVTAAKLADLFLSEIYRLHDLPSVIISDRDSRFTSNFWKELVKKLNIRLNMSTARHPETDGQTERMNRVLEEILRN